MGDQSALDDILLHTLGLTKGEEMYRNHFVASVGHHDWNLLTELERLGMMKRAPYSPSFLPHDSIVFHATDDGKARARIAKAKAGPKLWRVSYSDAGLRECDDIRGACEWSNLIRAKSRSAARYRAALNLSDTSEEPMIDLLRLFRAVREPEPTGATDGR